MTIPPTFTAPRYDGPYELWVFDGTRGLPFALPAIRRPEPVHYTALLEGPGRIDTAALPNVRLPPLWRPPARRCRSRPSSSRIRGRPTARRRPAMVTLAGQPPAGPPRFRLKLPVAGGRLDPNLRSDSALPGWTRRPKAIVGIIDDGIPFAHPAFLDGAGQTRISHCWLQAARAQPSAAVPFGRELVQAEIDALRGTYGADERRLYRDAGAIDASVEEVGTVLGRAATHGAHIAGLAAGAVRGLGLPAMDDDVAIIAVQLPNTIAWDTSGFGKEMHMLSALHYVLHRARAIADAYPVKGQPELPLVVNFSYGWAAGRHDGESEIERAMQHLLTARRALQPRTALVMPTGNNFATEMHGQIGADDLASGAYSFGWQMPPDDRTPSYLELWFADRFDATGYRVIVTDPAGAAVPGGTLTVGVGAPPAAGDPVTAQPMSSGAGVIGQISCDHHRSTRWRVLIVLAPTAYAGGETRRALSGRWTVTVEQAAGAAPASDQTVDAWVQRDDDPALFGSGGRQSRLVDLTGGSRPDGALGRYDDRLGFVRGYGALNGIATADAVTRVTGYDGTTEWPAAYAGSAGLRRVPGGPPAPWGVAPKVAAPSDQGPSRPGIPSIGVYGGSTARLVGTSAATALVSRAMVLNFAAGAGAFSGAIQTPFTPPVTTRDAKERARSADYWLP